MKLGGRAALGAGCILGGDPYGLPPRYLVDRVLAALARFKRSGTSGFLQTLDRLSGNLNEIDTWERLITDAGAPSMLVHYGGGAYKASGTAGVYNVLTVTITVICIATDYRDRRLRLEGKNVHQPGLDNMTRWAYFYAGRALKNIKSLKNARALREDYLSFEAARFVSAVSFAGELKLHWYEEHPSARLERLGICHSPRTRGTLFEPDNITPATDSPTSPSTGYAEIA